jgi:PST family polysaccharide transporter
MTSLNAAVIGIRLVVSFFIQRLLAELVGEAGISKIGQLRNLSQLLTSITSVGIFSGIVKYVAEYKEDAKQLQKLFSTTFVFAILGSMLSFVILFFGSDFISIYLFGSQDFSYLIKLLAVTVPFISLQRIFNGVVNGLSQYKKFAKIDLFGYLLSAALTVIFLLEYNIDGALVAIAITPIIQLLVLLFIFSSVLKEYIQFSNLSLKTPMAKALLAFSLMSFFSSVLLNYVEIDIRSMLLNDLSEEDAGIWTAMTFISKNYMVFSGAIFTLYVLPKFAGIDNEQGFKKELFTIYKTLLPIFGLGMLVVYFLRSYFVDLIYPGFDAMLPLFKWQLLGDFIRLASLVLLNQFLAKKLVRSFIFSEIISLGTFYLLAHYLVQLYGVEGVVMAHFIRYIVYFAVVFFLVIQYFNKKKITSEE